MLRRYISLLSLPALSLIAACGAEGEIPDDAQNGDQDVLEQAAQTGLDQVADPAAQAEEGNPEEQMIAPVNDDFEGEAFDEGVEADEEASAYLEASAGQRSYTTGFSCLASDLKFTRWPLDGTSGKGFTINNYLDLDTNANTIKDWMANTGSSAITYDGHNGIDIDISSFREMDAGTATVRAAANGTVTFIREDQYDRNTSCTGTWNVVTVQHANGYVSYYGHLKKNSVVVNVGDAVTAGQKLGVAGSSGCSTAPHLHFEVHNCSDARVDTNQTGMWSSPQPYIGGSDIMDVMLKVGSAPTVAEIKDPAPNPTVVKPSTVLGIGLSMGAKPGDSVNLKLIDPSSNTYANWSWTVNSGRYGHNFPAWTKTLGTQVGTWTLSIAINGSTKTTRTFNVSSYNPGLSEVAKYAVSASSYQTVFTDVTSAGYRPVWVDGYDVNGTTYYNAVFTPADGIGWVARNAMSAATYQNEVNTWIGQGYRILQVDSYLVGGAINYAAIFVKQSGATQAANHGQTSSQFNTTWNTNTAAGYRLVDLSTVVVGGTAYYTSLWDKANVGGWTAYPGLSESDYQTTFTSNKNAGRHLKYVNAYVDGSGVARLNAVFDSVLWTSFDAVHGATSSTISSGISTYPAQGEKTRMITGYAKSGTAYFAALWAK